jgi:hypothetical protein
MPGMFFRVLCMVMTALFVLSVAVQYNDPDPIQWMAIYGAGAVFSALAARGKPGVAWHWPALAAAIALVWGLFSIQPVWGTDAFAHMTDAWEMKNLPIEEARETCGLLFTAAWLGVLAVVAAKTKRAGG